MSVDHDELDDDPERLQLASYQARMRLPWRRELQRLEQTFNALADYPYSMTVEEVDRRLLERIDRLRAHLALIGPRGGVRRPTL